MKTTLARAPSAGDAHFARAAARAETGDLSVTALIEVADLLRGLGAAALTEELYRVWLRHNARHPLAHVVRFNFSVCLTDGGMLADAYDQLRLTLLDRPGFAPAAINLGSLQDRLGDRPGAIETWRGLADQLAGVTGEAVVHRCTALNQMGRVLETALIQAPAEAALRASLEIDPAQPEVIQHLLALRQAQCAWPVLAPVGRLTQDMLLAAASPLSLAALSDDPVLLLAAAHRYHSRDARLAGPAVVGQWPRPEAAQAARPLRIGYLGSDFREHAVGYLTAEIFALHDRACVKVFAYYCGPSRRDAMQDRFAATADHWTDIGPMSDRQAAAAMVADGIDILVDLNGYTKDGRIKLFAYQPAPVIVNWLGFPGTTGSPHHHYIIADAEIIPPCDERFYSERVLRLPCYQPNDRQRVVAAEGPTRAECGLPEGAFVFCVFNGPHKITPGLFAVWMGLLHAVPGAVLWLLCPEQEACDQLRAHAAEAGIDASRLVFAGRMANALHMGRFRLADLFLDTAPYGAHTTASDALWMGLPVVTFAGNSFAGRVCASLVRAAGIGELVCADLEGYRHRALELARDRPRLAALAARLRAGRDSCTLFDTPGLVRGLEGLFARMWQDFTAGTLPVPALDHLPRYHELGCTAGRPAPASRAALLRWWASRLAYRDAVQPMPPDGLLWPAPPG
jgi:predicted O-linked N-acetylglucosamine transferase (SPINDLY family)